jgi:hypothetical protein
VTADWKEKQPDKWFSMDIAGFDLSWAEPTLRGFINELVGIESMHIENDTDGLFFQYRPYPLSIFGKVLDTIYPDQPLDSFLEVGCGIGTKMLLTRALFPTAVVGGFDRTRSYIELAYDLFRQYPKYNHNLDISIEDAQAYDSYRSYDCIFLNRPIWDYDYETSLEHQVAEQLPRGGVLMLGNGLTTKELEARGWPIIATETALTVFRKPIPS